MRQAPNEAAEKARRKVVKDECDGWNATVPVGAQVTHDVYGLVHTVTIAAPMLYKPDWQSQQSLVGISIDDDDAVELVNISTLKRAG